MPKLNLGCGAEILKGYINVDIRKVPGCNVVADVHKLAILDKSIDEIRASHVIEHVRVVDLREVIEEWHRVLRMGGVLNVYCPNARQIAQDYIERLIDCEKFSRLLFGNQAYTEDLHYTSFDKERLEELFCAFGFDVIGREPRLNSYRYDLGIQLRKVKEGMKK